MIIVLFLQMLTMAMHVYGNLQIRGIAIRVFYFKSIPSKSEEIAKFFRTFTMHVYIRYPLYK